MSTDGWLPPGVTDAHIDRAIEREQCPECGSFSDCDCIWDASVRTWPRATQCACNPGCLSCAPSCRRS